MEFNAEMRKWVTDFQFRMFLKIQTQPFPLLLPLCFNDEYRGRCGACYQSYMPLTLPHQCWLSASGSEVPSRRWVAASSSSSGRRWRKFWTFSRLSLYWQAGRRVSVCSRGPLFLYSEPALSCARRTGRQTSALTIIELIVFFLCYCPLFQKSPAHQTKAHPWKPGLVRAGFADIRPNSRCRHFWSKPFRFLQRLLMRGLHLLPALKH